MNEMKWKRPIKAFWGALLVIAWAVAPLGAQDDVDPKHLDTTGDPRLSPGQIAPILEGLSDHHFPITTDDPMAQQFFDQGLRLTYGFNHAESLRAFREAARRDPNCAMAYWGQALTRGPNLNLPMPKENIPAVWEAIGKAIELKGRVSQKERDYIDALAARFAPDDKTDRAQLDRAYADSMRRLSEKYPDDLDAATMYAASLMALNPWNYWTKDGIARPNTAKLVSILKSVFERDPSHIGALHYHIHAVEASQNPGRAMASADLLAPLMPGAGHMVHMPSHIYARVGRYGDASEANRLAALADEGYITQCSAQGIYPLAYYPHNIHFLSWTSSIEGRSALALEMARKVAAKIPAGQEHISDQRTSQHFLAMPLYMMARFNRWEEILAEPRPSGELVFLYGVWRYARGLAYANTGKLSKAREELAALTKLYKDPEIQDQMMRRVKTVDLLAVALHTLAGELAAKEGKAEEAVSHLDRAVRLQDGLGYSEPPYWYYPTRQSLGAVLLESGRAGEAEVVYWEDLRRNPETGWSLFGLMKSLEAQEKAQYAKEARVRLKKAWAAADVELTSSRTVARR